MSTATQPPSPLPTTHAPLNLCRRRAHGNPFTARATSDEPARHLTIHDGMDCVNPCDHSGPQPTLPSPSAGDASMASPFTAKAASVMPCTDIIKQGRSTLVTTIQVLGCAVHCGGSGCSILSIEWHCSVVATPAQVACSAAARS